MKDAANVSNPRRAFASRHRFIDRHAFLGTLKGIQVLLLKGQFRLRPPELDIALTPLHVVPSRWRKQHAEGRHHPNPKSLAPAIALEHLPATLPHSTGSWPRVLFLSLSAVVSVALDVQRWLL